MFEDLDGFDVEYRDMISSVVERRNNTGFSSASDLITISCENDKFVLYIETGRKVRIGQFDTYHEASDAKLAIAFLVVRYHNNRNRKIAQDFS